MGLEFFSLIFYSVTVVNKIIMISLGPLLTHMRSDAGTIIIINNKI